jgi:hypothetical protein
MVRKAGIYNAIPEGILTYVAKCCHLNYKKK